MFGTKLKDNYAKMVVESLNKNIKTCQTEFICLQRDILLFMNSLY